jgi:hypothetical protein
MKLRDLAVEQWPERVHDDVVKSRRSPRYHQERHQLYFIPARRAAHLLLAVTFAAGTVLATPRPATAKHGESEGDDGGHDRGRHLGWYKHDGPAFTDRTNPQYSGAWTGRHAWGGGTWGWQSGVIAGSAAWGVTWGLPRYAFFAPPAVFVPAPVFVSLPPMVVGVPWMQAPAPYYAPPPTYAAPAAAITPGDNWAPTPEAMLFAAVPPPVVMLPPPEVMIPAGPPPVILSPPAYALSVWPVLAFAPPMLAVAVLHDEWWSGNYRGRGGFYPGRGHAGSPYAASRVAATGFAGPPMAQRRGFAGFIAPFGGHGQDNGHGGGHGGGGRQAGGHGHDH